MLGGKFSAVNSSIKFPNGPERLRVSVPDDILKLVCKFVIKFKISGGLTPEEFGVLKTAVKKGIIVRSDEPGETL